MPEQTLIERLRACAADEIEGTESHALLEEAADKLAQVQVFGEHMRAMGIMRSMDNTVRAQVGNALLGLLTGEHEWVADDPTTHQVAVPYTVPPESDKGDPDAHWDELTLSQKVARMAEKPEPVEQELVSVTSYDGTVHPQQPDVEPIPDGLKEMAPADEWRVMTADHVPFKTDILSEAAAKTAAHWLQGSYVQRGYLAVDGSGEEAWVIVP